MGFFQNSVLIKHLKSLDKTVVNNAYTKFKECFHNPEIQHNIREAKEEQFQEGFLRELFVKVLGYTLNPQPSYNLTTELKNEKGANKADGAILKDGKAIAVIELKGTDTKDLDKINIQAFNYKNNQTGCIYVITSNFEKLRFFIHNSVNHLEFNLFTLTEQEFELLWLCLNVDCLLGGIPLKVKEESLLAEENVTKQLYKDYATFRIDLWQNMVKNRPDVDQLLLFKKTQKLLDRFLFIFFAEDSGLLPPNSISRIVERWNVLQEEDAYKPLYSIFNQYFGYINTGRKGKTPQDDIFAYNGGLFFSDEVLDNIVIDDDVLQPHVMKLTAYDFQSEIDVNILGHIFENSLSEIENVIAKLEGKEVDKNKTKRKKEGVFYTPKYITKYIVDNTVGKLCEEKKAKLGIVDEEYTKGRRNRKKETIKKLDKNLQAYRKWLLNITICDPACGSGAFLNQALEYLIAEHTYIDELQAHLLGRSIVFHDVSNHILEKNIYGVDINEESVDIAKLSLWLRTAQKGRRLTTLNNNLKCGNSLIDDPEVAGDKAFIWQKKFPEVFTNGGFDVVIGNPPYVRQELIKEIKPFLEQNYNCYNSVADLYTYFIEKGINLIRSQGVFSFILPNKFLKATYGKQIRKVIKDETNIELIFDFDDYPVFDDATTYPIIYILNKKKTKANSFTFSEINKRENTKDPIGILEQKRHKVSYESITDEMWNFINVANQKILDKLTKSSESLDYIVNKKIFRGLTTGKNDAFIVNGKKKQELIKLDSKNADRIKVLATGKEVKRNTFNFQDKYLLFTGYDDNIPVLYPDIQKEIDLYKDDLIKRYDKGENYWNLRACAYYEEMQLPKIIYPRINNKGNFYLDSKGEVFLLDNNFFISTNSKSLLALLNSKLIFFYLKNICTTLQGGFYDFRRDKISTIPISKNFNKVDIELSIESEKLIDFTNKFNLIKSNFIKLLNNKFEIEKVSKKLQDWSILDFKEFLKELKNSNIKLSLSEEAEWMEYFNEQKQKALNVKSEIKKTDNEIDQIVYELYGLTEDEIKIVEQEF